MYGTAMMGLLGGGGRYNARGVLFDGSNDYLTRGAAFTGAADTTGITFSAWLKMSSNGGANQEIFENGGVLIELVDSSSKVRFIASNTSGTEILNIQSNAITLGSWFHIAASFNASAGTAQIYLNDASAINTTTTLTTGTIDLTPTSPYPSFGAAANGANKLKADVVDPYFVTSALDLSNSSNRRKFISATGKPVDLGDTGEIPTGSSPIFYLSRRNSTASSFATNKGTGGGMTLVGALTNSSTSPST